jgi:hypothetical protein
LQMICKTPGASERLTCRLHPSCPGGEPEPARAKTVAKAAKNYRCKR